MGRQVCYCSEVVGKELGRPDDLLRLLRGHSAHHLHDQHGGGLSSADTTSDENEVLFPFTGGSTQAAVSGYGRHQAKVDTADLELAKGAQSVGDTLRGQDRVLE